jgi:serine/threonine protein kinase
MLMPPDAPAPSQQIGNYDLLGKIAEGGMGAVYKAKNRITGEIVAVKIIPPETAKNPILVRRFEQEFKAASLLDHPNVVKAIEFGTVPTPFLVMEFVDGESLGQHVERRGGPIPEDLAIHYITQVCDGLHRAHKQGLIHRDVKPDNILVTADGTAKLTDMGLVKDVEGELNLTRTGRGLGTPHFMAPEQFRNAKNADVKCDIYSLGATLYMMVTGEVPFAKTSPLDCWLRKTRNDFPAPRKVNPKLSERIDWAIRRAMSADPERRPASCREFVEDLTGQTTRRGGSEPIPAGASTPKTDLWYLRYKRSDGELLMVKGTTESIRQNVKAGNLGDAAAILVCRTKTGQFVPLRSLAEFRDLVVSPSTVAPTAATGRASKPQSSPLQPAPIPPASEPAIVDTQPTPRTVPREVNRRGSTSDPASNIPTEPFPVDALNTPAEDVPPWARHENDDQSPSWNATRSNDALLFWVVIIGAIVLAVVGLILYMQS